MSDDKDLAPDAAASEAALLRRNLAKLSFTGMGIHPALDQQLESLRATVKREAPVDVVDAEVEAVARILRELGDSNDPHRAQTLTLTTLLSQLSQQSQGPARDALQQLLKRFPKERLDHQLPLVIDTLLSLFHEDAPTPGLLGRLFGRTPPPANPTPKTVAATPAPALDDRSLLGTVERLLNGLQLPPDYSERLYRLRSQFDHCRSPRDILRAVEDCVDLMLDAVGSEQQRLQTFLEVLSQRLELVYRFLAVQDEGGDIEASATQSLESSLQAQVKGLLRSLREAANLDELRLGVELRLDSLLSSVSEFKSRQEDRQRQMHGQINALQGQLQDVQGQTSRLQDSLHEQRQRALTDALTGLPNRIAYQERLEQEFARFRRYGGELSLAVLDIDHFKRINDQHGHLSGDKALKAIAQQLQESLRRSDLVARYGGEEFVVLLTETNQSDAERALDKLRVSIQNQPIDLGGVLLHITVSFGLSSFKVGDNPGEVFERADKALYRAKETGRNRICVAD